MDQQNLTALFETETVAGNTGLQIFTFFGCILGVLDSSKILKSLDYQTLGYAPSESSRSVLLHSLGKFRQFLEFGPGCRLGFILFGWGRKEVSLKI